MIGSEIVERIADREGVDPVDLDALLYDVIDPDALEALISNTGDRHPQSNPRVEFTYYGYAVTVDANERIIIDEQPTETNGASRKESVDD